MRNHHFISYSSLDFALRLDDALAARPSSSPGWRDNRRLRPGEDWDEQLAEAIKTCASLIFVMTRDSVPPNSACKQEWTRALKYKRPVIPLRRGANYFAETRLPRSNWKTLAELAPQLAEIDLRCTAKDYDTAAQVLQSIAFDYLFLWGHSRLVIELYEKLQGKLDDPYFTDASLSDLGNCYSALGQTQRAIEYLEQALAISREIGDRAGEGTRLGNLAELLIDEGRYPEAIQRAEESLKIAEEIGSPRLGSSNNGFFARADCHAGNLPAARLAAESAR